MHLAKLSAFAVLGAMFINNSSALANDVEWSEVIVHQSITPVEVDLNESTVLCSHADYSAAYLKVLIPKLAELTLLNHQNAGAGAPCVAAGKCKPFGNAEPADILDPYLPIELVPVTVTVLRGQSVDHVKKTCTISLIERVNTTIRGVPFTHQRAASLGTRPYTDCVK
jgi:hypothetical protein